MKARKRTATLKLADYYMGRDREYRDELTPVLRANARETVRRVNQLLRRAGLSRKITSGWRPAAVNANVPGAARGSKHISCIAIDLEDRDGALDAWCLAHLDVLAEIGLWLEHPDATPDWCHLQTLPPASGNRVFEP
jgi:Peptidase M15